MPDFEAAKGGSAGQWRLGVLLNMSAQLALQNGLEKGAHFVLVPGGLKFNPAVAEIAHRPGNIEPLRDLPHGPAEPNALDIAFVIDLNGCRHASEDCFGLAPAATVRCLYCSGAGVGRSTGGRSSGGGTKRGSLEFRSNCSGPGCGEGAASGSGFRADAEARRAEEAGRISSLAMYPFSPVAANSTLL
jgi:hypothetical protein